MLSHLLKRGFLDSCSIVWFIHIPKTGGNSVMDAGRRPQVGRDQALLPSMLGVHVVDFSFF